MSRSSCFRIVQRGDLVYDAEAGDRGLVDGVRELWNWTHEAVPENARLLAYGAVVLTVVASVVRRRIDPIAVGALLSGALTFVFAGQSGVVATRYYIPVVALFAVAFALSLARLPTLVVAAGVLAVFFSFMPPPGTRDEVKSWTNEELGNGALVREVAEHERSGCVVAAAGLDLETSVALPVLVAITGSDTAPAVRAGETVLVSGPGADGNRARRRVRRRRPRSARRGAGRDGVSLRAPSPRSGRRAARRAQPARAGRPID